MRTRTRPARRWGVGETGIAALLLLPMPSCVASGGDLGGFPVCEASAALIVPCTDRPESECLLVGDNEQSQALFQFPVDDERLQIGARSLVDIGELLAGDGSASKGGRGELSDIEALARLGSGEVLVYGSHGRNNRCERKKKRRRYLGLRLGRTGAVMGEVGLGQLPKKADLAQAFGSEPTGLLAEVAAAVRTAEREADAGRCEAAFDIEGAVVVPNSSGGGSESVWIGLRSPRVRGKAVLARHDLSRATLRFDAVRLIDLEGQGIRALSFADGFVWGLSKSSLARGPASGLLWRFPLDALAEGSDDRPISAVPMARVPHESEGLAIAGRRIFVLADGRVGDGRCELEATHIVLSRPLEAEGAHRSDPPGRWAESFGLRPDHPSDGRSHRPVFEPGDPIQ